MKRLSLIVTTIMFSATVILCTKNGHTASQNLLVMDLVPHSCDWLITFDVISNREWLDISETVGFSHSDLTGPNHDCNPTCTKGEFEGWTLASIEEVVGFIEHAGIYYGNLDSYNNIRSFIYDYIGSTGGYVGFVEALGFTRDLTSPTQVNSLRLYSYCRVTCSDNYEQSPAEITTNSLIGAWLYRPKFLFSPTANFCASPTIGVAPLSVSFSDQSYQATSWQWNFGDGTTATDLVKPAHTYTSPGTYTISLTVTGANGSDTEMVTDYIIVQTPTFSDAANTEINANYNSDVFVYNWNTTFSDYDGLKYSLEQANDATAKAYAQANIATNQNTSFWGTYAPVYMVAEMNTRTAALPYIDLAKYYASYQNYVMAEYYSAYAFSINALADLYNGSAIWCCSIEGNRVGAPTTNLPASPSFYSAAYNGWLANINFATSLAYLDFIVDNPAYFPMVQLYASTAYDYAQAAYNDASAALAAAGTDYTVWALNAVQYAANDLKYRAESLSYINSAVLSYQEGDLETAFQQLVKGYGSGQYADSENAKLIWCASMESKGGTR